MDNNHHLKTAFCFQGILQIMEIGDVQRKDITDHPENYTLLTTLDEGLCSSVFIYVIKHIHYAVMMVNYLAGHSPSTVRIFLM